MKRLLLLPVLILLLSTALQEPTKKFSYGNESSSVIKIEEVPAGELWKITSMKDGYITVRYPDVNNSDCITFSSSNSGSSLVEVQVNFKVVSYTNLPIYVEEKYSVQFTTLKGGEIKVESYGD